MEVYNDVFEDLKSIIGCFYISDLRYEPYINAARAAVSKLQLHKYQVKQLSDLYEYLYGERIQFNSHETAKGFFGSNKRFINFIIKRRSKKNRNRVANVK